MSRDAVVFDDKEVLRILLEHVFRGKGVHYLDETRMGVATTKGYGGSPDTMTITVSWVERSQPWEKTESPAASGVRP